MEAPLLALRTFHTLVQEGCCFLEQGVPVLLLLCLGSSHVTTEGLSHWRTEGKTPAERRVRFQVPSPSCGVCRLLVTRSPSSRRLPQRPPGGASHSLNGRLEMSLPKRFHSPPPFPPAAGVPRALTCSLGPARGFRGAFCWP